MTEVYLASSDGEGGTFTNRRVSSVAFDSGVGPTFGPAYGTDFGTRLGLTSNDDGTYAAWTDTRLGNQDTGRQDVFGATISVSSGGRLSVLLPVLAVLVLVGALAFWLLRRRARATPATPGEPA